LVKIILLFSLAIMMIRLEYEIVQVAVLTDDEMVNRDKTK